MALILVDMDDVLVQTAKAASVILADRYPERNPGFDSIPWDLRHDWQLSKQELYDVFDTPGFFTKLEAFPGAIDGLEEIASRHTVFLCSTPITPHSFMEKQQWVLDNVPWLNKRLVLTNDKTLVHGDWLLDDKPVITGACVPTWKHIHVTRELDLWNNVDSVLKRIERGT